MARLFTAASAAALSLALIAGAPAIAQDQTRDAVMTELAELGIDTSAVTLSDEEVLQVQALLSDAGMDETNKRQQIEMIIAE